MKFGFSTGDEGISEPDSHATAYPAPEGWMDSELPRGAYWHTTGWSGAVLPYQKVVEAGENGRQLLLDFLNAAQRAGSERMVDAEPAQPGLVGPLIGGAYLQRHIINVHRCHPLVPAAVIECTEVKLNRLPFEIEQVPGPQ